MTLWPMSIMIFSTSGSVFASLVCFGSLGIGPLFLSSSFQLGDAARHGHFMNSFDVTFPLGYTAAVGIAAGIAEIIDRNEKETSGNKQQESHPKP
mmetsp:Transcript_17514/g.26590  ORF Transcript_17514/g.26590 Transcript_17514/m.26590 type:complete len:95 (+) Transcript_17514:182-466(+)